VDNSDSGVTFPRNVSEAQKQQALRLRAQMLAAKSNPPPPPIDPRSMKLVDASGHELKPHRLRLQQRKHLDAWARAEAIRTAPPTIADHPAYNGPKKRRVISLVPRPSWMRPLVTRCFQPRRPVSHRGPRR